MADANDKGEVSEREHAVLDREIAVDEREHRVLQREASLDRGLIEQLRAANEHLVLATIAADETSDRARDSSDQKDHFIAMAGHELRSPLSPIVTALELMQLGSPDVFVAERALIRRHVQTLIRLIDDLLDVSRDTSGKLVLRRERVNLATIVEAAVEVTASMVAIKSHTLTVDRPVNIIVDGDPVRLTQMVVNLITNAVKYTPKRGSIRVAISRRGHHGVVAVTDNGIGIASEMLPRVFELFTQDPAGAAHSDAGLGLGLAIVRRLATLHGGTVTAHSRGEGHGSTFELVLPAVA